MKDDRPLMTWFAVPMVFGLLLLAVLMWIGVGRWQETSRLRRLSESRIVLPQLEAQDPPAPAAAAAEHSLTEEELNQLLDSLLQQRVQSVGAIENEAILRF
jgi:hypothetical protein